MMMPDEGGPGLRGRSSLPRRMRRARLSCDGIPIDPFRAIPFPNAMRECRRRAGCDSLLALSALLPGIPYIRLAKIERGEVFARADELRAIAQMLDLEDPAALLIDIDEGTFSLEQWVGGRIEPAQAEREAEELAMLLAAALRTRRREEAALTLTRLNDEYGLPAVMVSRLENAARPFDRWNRKTMDSLCALFGVDSRAALADLLRARFDAGMLAGGLEAIPGAQEREARTRERVAALRAELARASSEASSLPEQPRTPAQTGGGTQHMLQVMGVPAADGLIDPFPNPQHIAPPPGTGEDAYALRMCRASLGPAIPGGAVLIVDPARYTPPGGLAVLREEGGLRVLALVTDREGRLFGYSSNPEHEIPLDPVSASDLAMVTAVLFP